MSSLTIMLLSRLLYVSLLVCTMVSCGGNDNATSVSEPEIPGSASDVRINFRALSLPKLPSQILGDVVYGNGVYVVGGDVGVVRSTDGESWTSEPLPTDPSFVNVAFGNGRFVGISREGIVLTSTNGAEWVTVPREPTVNLSSSIAYGAGRFVALGIDSVYSSQDGSTWTKVATRSGDDYFNVQYVGGRFFVGSGAVVLTSVDGITWTETKRPSSLPFINISFGNGTFVMVASRGASLFPNASNRPTSTFFTSVDGVSWNQVFESPGEGIMQTQFANGRFVAVGYSDSQNYPGVIRTTEDGIRWTLRSTISTPLLRSVATANGEFVAGGNGTDFLYSKDGIEWYSIGARSFEVDRIRAANNRFFTYRSNTDIMTSADGRNWKSVFLPLSELMPSDVIFANGQFVALGVARGAAGPIYGLATSPNGLDWTTRRVSTNSRLRSVTYGGGQYVAVGDPPQVGSTSSTVNQATILTSNDGITWVQQVSGTSAVLKKVIYGNGQYLAVGEDNYKYSLFGSSNGIDWEPRLTNQAAPLALAYGAGKFVAVGGEGPENGKILTSSDGKVWTPVPITTKILLDVTFGDGRFVAVGADSVMNSSDGLTWTQRRASPSWLTRVVYGDGTYLGFGIVDLVKDKSSDAGTTAYEGFIASKDGINWTTTSAPAELSVLSGVLFRNEVAGAAFGNGRWVRVQHYPTGSGGTTTAFTVSP